MQDLKRVSVEGVLYMVLYDLHEPKLNVMAETCGLTMLVEGRLLSAFKLRMGRLICFSKTYL